MNDRPPSRHGDSALRLEMNEETLSLATDAGGIGVWDVDLQTGVLTWSDRTKAMFGISPNIACTLDDFYAGLHPDDLAATSVAFAAALDPVQRLAYDVEYRTVGREDGVVRWVAARGRGLFDPSGTCVRAIGTVIDITVRREAEAERLRLAALVEQSSDFKGFSDLAGKTSYLNEAGLRLVGLVDEQAAKTTTTRDYLFGDARALLRDDILPALERHGRWEGETNFRHFVTGAAIPVQVTLFTVRGAAGQPIGYGTVARDLTDRLRAEEALRRMNETLERRVAERTAELRANEARLRTVFETSHQLQGLLMLDGTVLEANAIALQVVGCRPEDVVGRRFWDCPWFTDTEGGPELARDAVARAASGEEARQEVMLDVAMGQRVFDMAVRPIRGPDGAVVAIVLDALDITERRQAEAALRQSQKMEAFGQLTGGVAHDFNNLLQAISGGLEMLGRKHVHSDAGHKLIGLIGNAAERGAQLTRQLLAFARKEQLASRPTDVNATVAASGQLLDRSIGGELVIERHLGPDVWPAMTDPGQLDIAVLNLVINARDAMPEGGVITLATSNATAPGPGVPDDLQPGDYVRLSVADTGIGMEESVRERVFEPFFTTKGVGKGTGLGLSQVYGFAHQSRGTVRILSAPGQGTAVEIYLPRAESGRETAAPDSESTEWFGCETVLVVDDDRDVRALAVESLQEMGYRVLQAENGAAGLQVLSTDTGIDLLLVDFAMPSMNGAELVRLARQLRPTLPVLFMTGYADQDAVSRHAGPDGVLHKPFKLAELAARVGQALDRHRETASRA